MQTLRVVVGKVCKGQVLYLKARHLKATTVNQKKLYDDLQSNTLDLIFNHYAKQNKKRKTKTVKNNYKTPQYDEMRPQTKETYYPNFIFLTVSFNLSTLSRMLDPTLIACRSIVQFKL